MDLELAKFLFQVLTFLVAGGTGFYVFMSNKDKVTNDRIEKLEDDIDEKFEEFGQRVATLEAGPGRRDIGELHNKINLVSGDMRELKGKFDATNNTLSLIHQTLMKGNQ